MIKELRGLSRAMQEYEEMQKHREDIHDSACGMDTGLPYVKTRASTFRRLMLPPVSRAKSTFT